MPPALDAQGDRPLILCTTRRSPRDVSSSRPSLHSPVRSPSPSAIAGSHKTFLSRFILVQKCFLANPPSTNSPGTM